MRKRIMLVFGTRPEAIKMAPVYRALRADPESFDTLCCVTAQHRALLDQALETFAIVPDFDLHLMRARQDLSDLTAAVLTSMRPLLATERPDLILVHGDTTTTLGAALAGYYEGIPIGHVEAGLRSGDLAAPFPEEFNRRAVDLIARHRFAPTEQARQNLLAEGLEPQTICVTGNTVIDAALHIRDAIKSNSALRASVDDKLEAALGRGWRRRQYVLVTCHRRENHGSALAGIAAALARLCTAFPMVNFVLPLHPNPAVMAPLRDKLVALENMMLIEPLPYDAFIEAIRHCQFLLSDSGGLQEEALALGKPILVMREVTERSEAIDSGGAKLVGTDAHRIAAEASMLLQDASAYARMAGAANPFGDGRAAERIVSFLKQF